jgi:hypothetical protein
MYQELREEMGLDDSLFVRYARWMGLAPQKQTGKFDGLLEGNLGQSNYFKKDVIEVVQGPIGNTIFINIFATILLIASKHSKELLIIFLVPDMIRIIILKHGPISTQRFRINIIHIIMFQYYSIIPLRFLIT